MSGSGIPIGALKSEEERERGRRAIERQEKFSLKHPEIGIKAERDHERLVFRVKEPGRKDVVWSDPNEMMDDLEGRYPE